MLDRPVNAGSVRVVAWVLAWMWRTAVPGVILNGLLYYQIWLPGVW